MVISQKLDIKRFIKEKKLEEMHLEKGFFLIIWITIDTDVNTVQTLAPHSIFSLMKRPFYKIFCFLFFVFFLRKLHKNASLLVSFSPPYPDIKFSIVFD